MTKIAYWHSTSPVVLRIKGGSTASLEELCKSSMVPCRLNPFLFNGHLQTIWTTFARDSVPIYYKRHIFHNDDPAYSGEYAVDFATTPNTDSDPRLPPRTTYFTDSEFQQVPSLDDGPMLVMLHGLSGGSHEVYLRHVLASLVSAGGWHACVVISRGCSRSRTTSSILYNARATWDIRQTVRWLRRTFPNRPLYGIGFSLGANILTNYLGEEGEGCELKAAVIISNPWDLHASSLALQRTWFNLNAYSATMGASMKKLFEEHVDQISKNPKIDVVAVRKIKYLHEFDRHVQAPTWGYPTEGAYYRDASSVDSVLAIRIPFLAIHAEDDPVGVTPFPGPTDGGLTAQVTASEALPRQEMQQTPYGLLCTTPSGGHLGWFELGGSRWFAKVTTAFLQKLAHEVDWEATSTAHDMPASPPAAQKGLPERNDQRPVFEPMRRKMYIPAKARSS